MEFWMQPLTSEKMQKMQYCCLCNSSSLTLRNICQTASTLTTSGKYRSVNFMRLHNLLNYSDGTTFCLFVCLFVAKIGAVFVSTCHC